MVRDMRLPDCKQKGDHDQCPMYRGLCEELRSGAGSLERDMSDVVAPNSNFPVLLMQWFVDGLTSAAYSSWSAKGWVTFRTHEIQCRVKAGMSKRCFSCVLSSFPLISLHPCLSSQLRKASVVFF